MLTRPFTLSRTHRYIHLLLICSHQAHIHFGCLPRIDSVICLMIIHWPPSMRLNPNRSEKIAKELGMHIQKLGDTQSIWFERTGTVHGRTKVSIHSGGEAEIDRFLRRDELLLAFHRKASTERKHKKENSCAFHSFHKLRLLKE